MAFNTQIVWWNVYFFYIGQTNFPLETSGEKNKNLVFAASLSLHVLLVLQTLSSCQTPTPQLLPCLSLLYNFNDGLHDQPYLQSIYKQFMINNCIFWKHCALIYSSNRLLQQRSPIKAQNTIHVSGNTQELLKIEFHTQCSSFSVLRHQISENMKEWCVFQL